MTYNIVIINGSPRGQKSTIRAIFDSVTTGLKAHVNIETNYIDLIDYRVSFCKGCLNCFETGNCPLDSQDDMLSIKKMILAADVALIGTPIYAGNVTAQMKLLLDRLAYWMHLMCLCGKPTAFVTSSCGNGVNYVKTYLTSILRFLGGREISFQNYIVFSSDDWKAAENVSKMNELIADILGVFNDPMRIGEKERKDLEYVFHAMQRNIRIYEDEPNFEYHFWKKHGFFEYSSYMDVILESKQILSSIEKEM